MFFTHPTVAALRATRARVWAGATDVGAVRLLVSVPRSLLRWSEGYLVSDLAHTGIVERKWKARNNARAPPCLLAPMHREHRIGRATRCRTLPARERETLRPHAERLRAAQHRAIGKAHGRVGRIGSGLDCRVRFLH